MMLHLILLVQLLIGSGDACDLKEVGVQNPCALNETLTVVTKPGNLTLQNCSSEVNVTEFTVQPSLQLESASANRSYTVLLFYLNSTSSGKDEYTFNWLVSNVDGEDLSSGDVTKGRKLLEYKSPEPPKENSTARFEFLVFAEDKYNETVEMPKDKSTLQTWVKEQKNNKLCGPIAGILFTSQ